MKRRPTVLLTGFEPFGGWARNVSAEAVQALDGRVLAGALVAARVLPVAYPRALRVLDRALDEVRPDAVVAFGIHGQKAHGFRVESLAANSLEFRIPDNDGTVRSGEAIDPAGPGSRRVTLDSRALAAAIRSRGLRVRHSRDAGRYLCNAVYYWLLGRTSQAAFVHVPPREPGEDGSDVLACAEAAATVAASAAKASLTAR